MIINITDKNTYHSHDIYTALDEVIGTICTADNTVNIVVVVDTKKYTIVGVSDYLENIYGFTNSRNYNSTATYTMELDDIRVELFTYAFYFRLTGLSPTHTIIPNRGFIDPYNTAYAIWGLAKARTKKNIIGYI